MLRMSQFILADSSQYYSYYNLRDYYIYFFNYLHINTQMRIQIKWSILVFCLALVVAYLVSKFRKVRVKQCKKKQYFTLENKENMIPIEKIIKALSLSASQHKPISFREHLERIIFSNLQGEQSKNRMQKLLNDWKIEKETSVENLLDKFKKAKQYGEEDIEYFKHSEVLSARVYQSISLLIMKSKSKSGSNRNLNKFIQYFTSNRLEIAYHSYIFSTRSYSKNSSSFYSSYGQDQSLDDKKNIKYLEDLQKWCQDQQNQDILEVIAFLKAIKLIDTPSSPKNNNTQKESQNIQNKKINYNIFMTNLQRIPKQQQKKMYCSNWMIDHWQLISTDKVQQKHATKKYYPNYNFYSKYQDNHIRLSNKAKDYRYLQSRHDYIQWMFPNHFGSSFNSEVAPLNYIEKEIFLNDPIVALNMLRSIQIFFDFMGLQVSYSQKQQFDLRIIDEKRLKDVILVNHHNHLRLMRILACLSVIGFRSLALRLIAFLDELTHPSNNNYTYPFKKQRYEFEKKWQIYGDNYQGQTKKAKSMCFLQRQTFPGLHSILKEYTQSGQYKDILMNKDKAEKEQSMTFQTQLIEASQCNLFSQTLESIEPKQGQNELKAYLIVKQQTPSQHQRDAIMKEQMMDQNSEVLQKKVQDHVIRQSEGQQIQLEVNHQQNQPISLEYSQVQNAISSEPTQQKPIIQNNSLEAMQSQQQNIKQQKIDSHQQQLNQIPSKQ